MYQHHNILTFDLGLTTGYALAYKGKIYSGCFKLQNTDFANFTRFKEFLCKLFGKFKDIHLIIYEMNFPSRKIRWQTTSYGSLQYILLEFANKYGKEITTINPSTVKKSIGGRGNATKSEIITAVKKYTGTTPRTYHEADALAILLVKLKKYNEC